ncbi:hypothetical protein MVEN_01827500 [Mycena venus]|uniref:Uncharacterized protein n=1 Tax=Mycena venus TaxID=2733690 RepID=A0A8H7CLT1_9AGAR|nr:hypothetical protein MVEN_01827500 [Mycena venus]
MLFTTSCFSFYNHAHPPNLTPGRRPATVRPKTLTCRFDATLPGQILFLSFFGFSFFPLIPPLPALILRASKALQVSPTSTVPAGSVPVRHGM